jgi:hypothetical protein
MVTHKISPVTDYYQLLENILVVFPTAKFSKLTIQYKDSDDDPITLAEQADMDMALKDNKGQPYMRFSIKMETPDKDTMPIKFALKKEETPKPPQ